MPTRVLRSAAREVYDVLRAATATHRRLRDHLTAILFATVGVDVVCALVAFLLERHASETEIKTFGSAAFWTTTQLLTVSSNIKNPISTGARLLDVFMEIWAITVIAMLAGAFGSFSAEARPGARQSQDLSRPGVHARWAWKAVRWSTRANPLLGDLHPQPKS